MPDKLYQEYRTVISGCRAIFEDLRESGVDTLPPTPVQAAKKTSVPQETQDTTPMNNAVGADAISEIQQELTNCQRCTLKDSRTQVLHGSGNPNARLALVGQAPGLDEDTQGDPFAGEAGQLLSRILHAMKLKTEDVYICNLVKCRPPNDRDPEKNEIEACEGFLKRQLQAVAPEAILSLGEVATQTLLSCDEPISQQRGNWSRYEGIPLLPTFHPADLLLQPARKHLVWEDIKQVMHRLQDANT